MNVFCDDRTASCDMVCAELVASIQRLQARLRTPELNLELDALRARKRSLRYDVDAAYAEMRAYKDKDSRTRFERALRAYEEDQIAFSKRINALSVCTARPTPWTPDPSTRPPGFFKKIAEAGETAFVKTVCGRNIYVIRALKDSVEQARRELHTVRCDAVEAAMPGFTIPTVKPMRFELTPAPEIPDALTPAQSLDTDYIEEQRMLEVRAEQERARAEQERARAEQDRSRAEQDRSRAEQDRSRAEQDRKQAETARIDRERREEAYRLEENMRQEETHRLAADRAAFTANEGPKVFAKVDAWVAFTDQGSKIPLSKALAQVSGHEQAGALVAKIEALSEPIGRSAVFGFLERAARDTADAAYAAMAATYNRVIAWPLMLTGVDVVGPKGSASWILNRACGSAGYSRARSESTLAELRDFLAAVNMVTASLADQLTMVDGAYPHIVRMYTSVRGLEARIADCRDTHELSLVFHEASEKAMLRDNESIAHMVAWLMRYVRENTDDGKKQMRLLAGIATRYIATVADDEDTEPLRGEVSTVRERATKMRFVDVVEACDAVLAKISDGFFDAEGGARRQHGGGVVKVALKMIKAQFRYYLRHDCGMDPYYDTVDRLQQNLGTLREAIDDYDRLLESRVDAEADRRVRGVHDDRAEMAQKRVWHDTLMIQLNEKHPKSKDIARVMDAFESTSVEELGRMIKDVFAYEQPTVEMWRTEPVPERVHKPMHRQFVEMGARASKAIEDRMSDIDTRHASMVGRFEDRSADFRKTGSKPSGEQVFAPRW